MKKLIEITVFTDTTTSRSLPAEHSACYLWLRDSCLLVQLIIAALTIHIASDTALVNGGNQAGTICTNTVDSYTLTANAGDNIVLRLGTVGFFGNLYLYGPNGALLNFSASGTDAELDYTATNCGTFTLLVSSYYSGGTGTYGLTASGLAFELKLCPPVIEGPILTLNGVGGSFNAVFVLYSTTNVATPFALWAPILTNHFDQFGAFAFTNEYNPGQQQMYFFFAVP